MLPHFSSTTVIVTSQEYRKAMDMVKNQMKEENEYNRRLVGALGEIGFAGLYNLPVNIGYMGKPPRSDFNMNGCMVDIKTSSKIWGNGQLFVDGRINRDTVDTQTGLDSDLYVMAVLCENSEKHQTATVNFLGWMTKPQLLNCVTTKKEKGFRYALDWTLMNNMSDLPQFILENVGV
jgi:hypothetical protein